MSAPSLSPNPYKLLNSFEELDADLFFGRDLVADQVLARIIAHQLTVLHARSGTGKSSLLMARTIPELFLRCFIPVRTTPNPHPVLRVRERVLATLAPPPSAEQAWLERTWRECGKPGTVGELTDRARTLTAAADPEGHSTWTARFLRGGLTLEDFIDHLSALYAAGHGRPPSVAVDHGNLEVAELFDLLTDVARGHEALLSALPPESASLRRFFEAVYQQYGRHRARFRLVLIIDQFEEVFTSGGEWRRKWEFFEQLRQLWRPEAPAGRSASLPDGATAVDPEGGPPKDVSALLRFVFSLRSDYLADLEPLRAFADLDDATFHIPLLAPAEARLAVAGPPRESHGIEGLEPLAEHVVGRLTKEERFVDPPELQVVCFKLWDEWAKSGTREGAARELTATLERLGGPETIVDTFLTETLARGLGADTATAVDVLSDLITLGGTRNIRPTHELLRAPFQSTAKRRRVLRFLADRKFIREERRLGGDFVEIAHEFLVPPIRRLAGEWRDKLRSIEVGKSALARLSAAELKDGGRDRLEPLEWQTIDEQVGRFALPLWAFEAMLEASLRQHDVSARAAALWFERYRLALRIAAEREREGVAVEALRFSVNDGQAPPALGVEVSGEEPSAVESAGPPMALSLFEWRRLASMAPGVDFDRQSGRLVLSGLKVAVPGVDDALLRRCAEGWVASCKPNR